MKLLNTSKVTRVNSALKMVLASCVLFALVACGSTQTVLDEAPPEENYQIPQYKIGAGDQIGVSVWKNDDLSVKALVRPDGMISLPLIGDIQAADYTTEDLAAKIADKLNTFVRTPQVAVTVENPSSADFQRRVRVTGAVNNPTTMAYRDGMTVLDLVLAAGGINEFASGNKGVLHRKNAAGERIAYRLRLKDILVKGDLSTNYALRPSDVVTVPERAF